MADAKQRDSFKVESWDHDDNRWSNEHQGSEESSRDAYAAYRDKFKTIPVRLVQVAETTLEAFSPPAPWHE